MQQKGGEGKQRFSKGPGKLGQEVSFLKRWGRGGAGTPLQTMAYFFKWGIDSEMWFMPFYQFCKDCSFHFKLYLNLFGRLKCNLYSVSWIKWLYLFQSQVKLSVNFFCWWSSSSKIKGRKLRKLCQERNWQGSKIQGNE